MALISSAFLLFILIVWLVYQLLPTKWRPWALLLASLFFYGSQGLLPLAVLLTAATLTWLAMWRLGRRISRGNRLLLRLVGLVTPLLLLIFFKYSRLLLGGLNGLLAVDLPLPMWVAPLGISFFLFKLMAATLDHLRGERPVPYSWGQLLLFSAYFPQILSGPIDRAKNLIPQLWRGERVSGEDLSVGLTRIVWGLFKKVVIADRLALFVNPVFSRPMEYQGLNVLLAVYFYTFQIYCDFSGYSDMAIGLCRLFGIRSLENFARPYSSATLSEFWNRWHITLSHWLRDYLFLPLSYAILPKGGDTRLRNVHTAYTGGIVVTMLLGGLWHAPSWTMLTWGGLHGLYLAIGQLTKRWRKRLWTRPPLATFKSLRPFLAKVLTFHLVALAWIFFKSPSFGSALKVIRGVDLTLSGTGLYHLLFTALFLLLFLLLKPVFDDPQVSERFARSGQIKRMVGLVLLFVLTVVLAVDQQNEFIYFNF